MNLMVFDLSICSVIPRYCLISDPAFEIIFFFMIFSQAFASFFVLILISYSWRIIRLLTVILLHVQSLEPLAAIKDLIACIYYFLHRRFGAGNLERKNCVSINCACIWKSHVEDELLEISLSLMDHNRLSIKTFMAITAERDSALRERNMALEERKRALAERDMAMLQRDAAIAERNAVIQERDEALATLQYQDSSMNNNTTTIPNSLGTQCSPRGSSRGSDINDTKAAENPKPKKGRSMKHGKMMTSSKSSRAAKREAELPAKQVSSNPYDNGWNNEQGLESSEEYLEKAVSWKDNLGLNQINFDESAMPVPVCTCTGSPQPCYRWGNGGWQSACCTTTISMYPLPQVANKRYTRVGGRKMSGSAFNKLLNRLAAEGCEFSSPLDLKDHWAKHGTNRYSTLK